MGKSKNYLSQAESQNPAKSDEWTGNSEKELLDLVVEILIELIIGDEGEK